MNQTITWQQICVLLSLPLCGAVCVSTIALCCEVSALSLQMLGVCIGGSMLFQGQFSEKIIQFLVTPNINLIAIFGHLILPLIQVMCLVLIPVLLLEIGCRWLSIRFAKDIPLPWVPLRTLLLLFVISNIADWLVSYIGTVI